MRAQRRHGRRVSKDPRRSAGGTGSRRFQALQWRTLGLLLSALLLSVAPQTAEKTDAAAVQALQKELADDTARTAEERLPLESALQAALDDLTAADQSSASKQDYETLQRTAPDRLAEQRTQLEALTEFVAPPVDPSATLVALEAQLRQAQADWTAAQEKLASLDEERRVRGERRSAVPEELSKAREEVSKLEASLPTISGDPSAPLEDRIRRAAALAKLQRLRARIGESEAELSSYDARGDLLVARRDVAARQQGFAKSAVEFWQERVGERRRQEEDAARAAAEAAKAEARDRVPVVAKVLEANARLADERANSKFAEKIDGASKLLAKTRSETDRVRAVSGKLKDMAAGVGVSDALGMILRRQREQLPDLRELQTARARNRDEIAQITVRLFELQERRDELSDLDPSVAAAAEALGPEVESGEKKAILAEVRAQLEVQRNYVESLVASHETYSGILFDLDQADQDLASETTKFQSFIEERILWIRSAERARLQDLDAGLDALVWLVRPKNWWSVAEAGMLAVQREPIQTSSALLAFLVLLGFQGPLRRRLQETGLLAAKRTSQSFRPTLVSLACTVGLSLPWPALLVVVGWRLGRLPDASEFAQAVGNGLWSMAIATLPVFLVRGVCRGNGLGVAHFGWPERGVRVLWHHSLWVLVVGGTTTFVVRTLAYPHEPLWDNTLGRGVFVVGLLVLSLFVLVVFRSKEGIFSTYAAAHRGGVLDRYGTLVYLVLALLPLVLAVLSLLGFHYTAQQLFRNLSGTLLLFLGLLLADALTRRWILISRRRLLLKEARRRAEEAAKAGKEDAGAEPPLDLSIVSAQTRVVQQSVMNLLFLFGLWFVWRGQLPAVNYLEGRNLWGEAGDGVTLADLVMFLIFLFFTVQGARNLPGILELTVLQRFHVGAGERYAITTLARYVIVVAGLGLAFNSIDIGWSKVQWLAAAITVGLGFGLQEIFANFVSGVILLFERPIRVGDTVTVGGVEGRVTKIRMRATTVLDWNRRELVIPNREFITGQLVNWTLTDTITRITVAVGVAYGSDVDRVESLLYRIAKNCRWTRAEPGPRVVFLRFGDNSLDFELRVFVDNYDDYPNVVHDLHRRIEREFREAGIEIAFPQRDLHIRSLPPLRVERWPEPGRDEGRDDEATDGTAPAASRAEEDGTAKDGSAKR